MVSAVEFAAGCYRYVPGVTQYSGGATALPGHEIIRVRFRQPLPLEAGFKQIEEIIGDAGRPLTSHQPAAGCQATAGCQLLAVRWLPGQVWSGQATPSLARPGLARQRPGQARSDQAWPGLANPSLARPGLARTSLKPGQAGPDHARPAIEPGKRKPGLAFLGQQNPDLARSGQAMPGQRSPCLAGPG